MVVVSVNDDPLVSFLNSIQVVKDAFHSLELNFLNAAKNCFNGVSKYGSLNGVVNDTYNELVAAQLDVKKNGHKVAVNGDDWRNGRDAVKLFDEMLKRKSANNYRSGMEVDYRSVGETKPMVKEGKNFPLELCTAFVYDQSNHLPKFDVSIGENEYKKAECEPSTGPIKQCGYFRVLTCLLEGKRAYVNGFLSNLKFARVGGVPPAIVGMPSEKNVEDVGITNAVNQEGVGGNSPEKSANGLPQVGIPSKENHPDKAEWKRFFLELDRDGDGKVTLEDLEVAVKKRKLPKRHAHKFMRHTRSHFFSKSFGWKQLLLVMEQKEPIIIQAYTSFCLSKSGTLRKSEILASLQDAGLPANEDNAVAMMNFLNAEAKGSISYEHFRNFMLLLQPDRLQNDPRTVVAVTPPVETTTKSVLKSALAGGLSCAFSAALMHPIDTVKTQVQASTSLSFVEILLKLPQIGVQGLYKGSIPAILGQFSSHGLRTGIFEASKLVLINVAPTIPTLQVQSVASVSSTVLGTVMRIPCEVLKQRLQAGVFDNVVEATVGTWKQDGLTGFFRGTGATLCREIPFYVAGTGLFVQSKKVVRRLLRRELEPWETIIVGAISGGLIGISTTPFDAIKTRMMIAPEGRSITATMVALSILRSEGPLGLFRGAVPRFFWIAPLGAINLAGYELLRKAMENW